MHFKLVEISSKFCNENCAVGNQFIIRKINTPIIPIFATNLPDPKSNMGFWFID